MNSIIYGLLFIGTIVIATEAADTYPTKYDDINIDSILNNRRLLDNYIKCFLGKAKCNEEGRLLKEIIPDALVTDCAKCNAKQRANVEKVIKFIVKNRRPQFDELAASYDPKGEYRSKYQKYLQ